MANFLSNTMQSGPPGLGGKSPGQMPNRAPWRNSIQEAMMKALLQQNRLNQPPGSQGPQNIPVDTLTALFQHGGNLTGSNDFQNFIRTLFQQPTGGGQ